MSINTTPTAHVTVNGEPLEFAQDFTYLISLIRKEHGGQKDTKARLGKARCAFAKLQNIWKLRGYGKDQCVPQWMIEKDLSDILAKSNFQRGTL